MCRFFFGPIRKRPAVVLLSPPPDLPTSWLPAFELVPFVERTLSSLDEAAIESLLTSLVDIEGVVPFDLSTLDSLI